MRRAPLSTVVPLLAALAAPLVAQSSDYTAPGSLGRPLVDRREVLQRAVEEARWHLGAVRVDPWLSLRELAWVEQRDAEGESVGDLTATAGAGLDAYLPVGSRTTFAAQAHPEYIWWRERTEQRRLAGRYAVGAFVHSNRLALELVARSTDSTTDATPELDRRVRYRQQRLELDLEVPVFRRLSLFGRGAAASTDVDDELDIAGLDSLDRSESWWVGGLRLKLGGDLSIGAGVGRSRTEFDRVGELRDQRGSSLYGELRWLRPKLQVAIEGFRSELDPAPGSSFEGFDGNLVTARARWAPRESFSLAIYGQRALNWSIEADRAFYVDERRGAEIGFRVGWRTGLRVFAERGEHRYAEDPSGAPRVDDVASEGAGADVELVRGLALALEGRRTRIESAVAGTDREFVELRASLTFGGGPGGVF